VYSGDDRYLDSYHTALAHAETRLEALQAYLVGDADVATLARLVQAKTATLRARIAGRQAAGAASNGDVGGQDEKLTNEIRDAVNGLAATQQALLANRSAVATAAVETTKTILLTGGPILLVALAFAAVMAMGFIKYPLERIIAGGKAIVGGDFLQR